MCNAYLPPTGNLARRDLTEQFVREQAETIFGAVPADIPAFLCGYFNARTASR